MDIQYLSHFLDVIPHSKQLGIKILEFSDKSCTVRMPASEEIRVLPQGPIASGPLITLLDTAIGCAITAYFKKFVPIATLDLRMDNLRTSRSTADLYCLAEVYHATKDIFFTRGEIWQMRKDRKHLLSTASATFMKTNKSIVEHT